MTRRITKYYQATRTKGQRSRDVYFDFQSLNQPQYQDLYCLSRTTVEMAYALVAVYGSWRNRFVFQMDADVWQGLLDEEWKTAQRLYELALEELKMPIGCDLNEGLSEIANAIKYLGDRHAATCCDNTGSGGAGGEEEPQVWDGTLDETTTYPPGFDDQPTYDTYKCNVAADIIEKIAADLEAIKTLNWNTLIATSTGAAVSTILATLMITPVPGSRLLAVVTILIGVLAAGFGALDSASTVFATVRNDLLCALYNATSLSEAKSEYQRIVGEEITNSVPSTISFAVAALLDMFANNDAFNRLFSNDETLALPTADCSSCEDQTYRIGYGILVSGSLGAGSTQFEISSVELVSGGTGARQIVSILIPEGLGCKQIDIDTVGWTPPPGSLSSVYIDCAGGVISTTNDPGTAWNDICVLDDSTTQGGDPFSIVLQSTATFTATFNILGNC